jgi:hypothetical protein
MAEREKMNDLNAIKINCYLCRANWFLENKEFSKLKGNHVKIMNSARCCMS